MSALPNPRHERFAQLLFKGKTQIEAYTEAGYKPDDGAANRLSGKVRIRERVSELQEASALKTETTVATLLEAGWSIINAAKAAGDYAAASSTLERAAKIAGLWIDKTQGELNSRVAVYSSQPLTAEEWEQQHKPPALQ